MNDAENLTKLLGHLPPAVFREFMADEFSLAMPDLDTKKPKKEQREQMEADLRQAYRAITSAGQKGRLLGSGVQAASNVRELYLEQFKGGKRTIFELLDSQMSYYTARRSQIETQYEVSRATYDVLRSTGELTRVLANAGSAGSKPEKAVRAKK